MESLRDETLYPRAKTYGYVVRLRDLFDKPFAGPEMRRKYEIALGKFLITFNAVEGYMRFTVAEITRSLGQVELWEKHLIDFDRQVKNLRLLILAQPYFEDIPFERLIALNETRNKLAHGHYDQDCSVTILRLWGNEPEQRSQSLK